MLNYYSLQSKTGNPTLAAVIYTIIFAFILSACIAVTYLKTFRGRNYSRNFIQSLILCAIIASTVIQAIGDSVAIGLGVLGALSIIRFRINIKNPRNIIFMFASLSVGIACGVFGYTIAIIGTLSFCLITFILYHSPYGNTNYYNSRLCIETGESFNSSDEIKKILQQYCERAEVNLVTRSEKPNIKIRSEYSLRFRKDIKSEEMLNELNKVPGISEIEMTYKDRDASI